ncbi:CHY zinc finger protein [Sporosarcina sp. FSL K6-1522]|uniref:CHY zinc finger protein n=1 Tax=Sporosarcina sp. FSL K6-1522 TaxID=2921554 RepID=UPI00315A4D76
MICIHCGNEQRAGRFCGNCGKRLGKHIVPPTVAVEANVHIEKLKTQSKMYGAYFIEHVKKPSLIHTRGETAFSNGLVNILLLGILISCSLYTFTRGLSESITPGFFSFFGGMLIFTLATMGIALLALVLITTFFGPPHSFKAMVGLYGAHLSPLLIGAVVSLLLMFVKSLLYGNLVLGIVFILAVFILPLYLMSFLLTQNPTNIDPLYGFMLYIVTFTVLFILLMAILTDSMISDYLTGLLYWLR